MPINQRDIFWDWHAACVEKSPAARTELARYVLEGIQDIAAIFHEAKGQLKDLSGDPSFWGYASGEPERVSLEVQALFETLQQHKPKAGGEPSYVLEPVESARHAHKQRVRLAREVLHWGHGVCLDWVLLFGACVFHALIYPVVIVSKGHAILGYWVREDDAMDADEIVLTGDALASLVEEKRIRAIDATCIPPDDHGLRVPFTAAEQKAEELFVPHADFGVDLRLARIKGIRPILPLDPWPENHRISPAEHFQWRPELSSVLDWWNEDNSCGVLALIGIGGAGKSALAHRFLSGIPGSAAQEQGVKEDKCSRAPDALFIWSFYEDPDVDRCAEALYSYLMPARATELFARTGFGQIQHVLARRWGGCRVLLVFDGVERLQVAPGVDPDREGGTFGQFLPEGTPLGRFMSWCCAAARPARLLATSRCAFVDLHRYGAGYREVNLGTLTPGSARALLRARGVIGSDVLLNEVCHEFGYHAQTLDLLGSALRLWCGGDASRKDELPRLEDVKALPWVRDQVWARVRALRFYERRLPTSTLNTLQMMTIFADLTVGERERLMAAVLQQPLAALHTHVLSLSYEYQLLPRTDPAERSKWDFHPSLKDYFYSAIDPEKRTAYHDSLASILLRVTTAEQLRLPRHLNGVLELYELIHQLVAAGRLPEAFTVYLSRMGAYDHLAQLGFNAIGLRAVLGMLKSPERDLLAMWERARLHNDAGGFLRTMGALDEGLRHYREAYRLVESVVARAPDANAAVRFNRSVALRNTSRNLVLRGRLGNAESEAWRAYEHEAAVGDKEGIQISLCMAAYAQGLQGRIPEAFSLYRRAESEGHQSEIANKEYTFHRAHLMLLAGLNEQAIDHITGMKSGEATDYVASLCDLVAVCAAPVTTHPSCDLQFDKLKYIEQLARAEGRTELEIRAQLAKAEMALRCSRVVSGEESLRETLPLAEHNGYGLLWIDLQVAQARLELACGRRVIAGEVLPPELEIQTPQECFCEAEMSGIRALNGQLKNLDQPAGQPDLPEEELAMLGARHPECGYAWGEGDALHLLGEARLALAECVGPEGEDSRGRSFGELVQQARQAGEEAVQLRTIIQDPNAKETQSLLKRIQDAEGGDGP